MRRACAMATLVASSAAASDRMGRERGSAARHTSPTHGDMGAQHQSGASSRALPRWPDSSVGVHEFLTVDTGYKGKPADIEDAASRFDFIWGSDIAQVWGNESSAIVPSLYTPYAWDGGWGGNLTWWQTHHPEWLLYKCDRKTPAYWNMVKANVPFDMSNRDTVQFHFDHISKAFASTSGYKALAADMFYLENTAAACGVWRAPTPSSAPQWVRLFSGARSGDPKWEAAQIQWAQQFRSMLHAHDPPLLLIPNYSLLGRSWNDPLLQRLLESVDGILDEQGYSNYAGMNSGAAYFENLLKHQINVQQKGCAYYTINEVKNTNDNATRRFVGGSYLQGRNNASALFMSAVQDYGEVVPRRVEFDAPVGRALGPATEPQPGCWIREFSDAVVAVNANKVNSTACVLPLDSKQFSYKDVYGHRVEGSEVTVVAADAAILLRKKLSTRLLPSSGGAEAPKPSHRTHSGLPCIARPAVITPGMPVHFTYYNHDESLCARCNGTQIKTEFQGRQCGMYDDLIWDTLETPNVTNCNGKWNSTNAPEYTGTGCGVAPVTLPGGHNCGENISAHLPMAFCPPAGFALTSDGGGWLNGTLQGNLSVDACAAACQHAASCRGFTVSECLGCEIFRGGKLSEDGFATRANTSGNFCPNAACDCTAYTREGGDEVQSSPPYYRTHVH